MGFCTEASDVTDPNAPPPRKGQKAVKVTNYGLSLEKFRLAIDLWGVEKPEDRREAIGWAAEFAETCNNAKHAAIKRQRKRMLENRQK